MRYLSINTVKLSIFAVIIFKRKNSANIKYQKVQKIINIYH